jgi:NitT/TauT family transport system substrate-binding protein
MNKGNRYSSDRRRFLVSGSALGAACLLGLPRIAAAEPPPETRRIRLNSFAATCVAPLYAAEELLKAEGFTDVEYLPPVSGVAVGPEKADLDMLAVGPVLTSIDAGAPVVVLAGMHLGCYELFGAKHVHAIRDLKGKTVPVDGFGNSQHVLLSSMTAYVGLDPRTDINWVIRFPPEGKKMFAEGKADAYLGFPPDPQELRAKGIGKVIVNTAVDKPWSQYYCCMLITHSEFVRKYPVATKRATRAMLKAADLCATQSEPVARTLVERKVTDRYDYALETLREVRYDAWRAYDPEDAMRFHAIRLHDVGLIKTSPNKLIAKGTDWRFLNELKKQLKA